MSKENYYVGLDIGTDSVGYAVTDEEYRLCKYKGNDMWGVTLFESANTVAQRRSNRTARRRLERRKHRVKLVQELFASEIGAIDTEFFFRIRENEMFSDNEKVRIFGTLEAQKEYAKKYPTVHHLIVDLMNNTEPHDVRLVYLACAWLVAHRGHFLSEVSKENIDKITDFDIVFNALEAFIRDEKGNVPWENTASREKIKKALCEKGIKNKEKLLKEALFASGKTQKISNNALKSATDEEYEQGYDSSSIVKLLCGGKVKSEQLFDKEEYSELDSISLDMNDEELVVAIQNLGDDGELIRRLKDVYDWSVLVDMLNGKETLSEAKVEIYDKHKEDLKALKELVRKYLPKEKYKEIFCETDSENNYVAYIRKSVPLSKSGNAEKRKTPSRADFCKYLKDIVKDVKAVLPEDEELYQTVCKRLESKEFLSKQVDGDNRVIPYQLYYYEMKRVLDNASTYLPFLKETDKDGFTVSEKLLSIMEFRIPYYVGPLRENKNGSPNLNHWMVRKEDGTVYPWNFEQKVDLDASEEAFIRRMTNTCTYCSGEDVLPKRSLLYSAFEVLNEINGLKINGNAISVSVKQEIYKNVFEKHVKVTPKRIKDYLVSNNYMKSTDELGGIDETIKSSLKSFSAFKNLRNDGKLTDNDIETIIERAAYSEERRRFEKWLKKEYPQLPDKDIEYVSGLNLKEFGRFSGKFLNGISGVDKHSGERFTIIRALWETNCVLMQLLTDDYTFDEERKKFAGEYYSRNPKTLSEQMDDLYLSNSVKRPVFRTLDILNDIVKVKGCEPKMIFVETTRGEEPSKKGKHTTSRYENLRELSKYFDSKIRKEFEELNDDTAKFQKDNLFLYFLQNGRCLYTGEEIGIENVLSGNGKYNIEHIYPRTLLKDDSVLNNIILVKSEINEEKKSSYPIKSDIQNKMRPFWDNLHKNGLLTDEKYSRLMRTTPFSEKEKVEFFNRQLVETGQSAKAVSEILRKQYKNTEVVFVKAQLASEFRKEFKLPKSRAVNDLHHSKDAYLNIVAGSVWHFKFGKKFYKEDAENNRKPDKLYTHEVKNGKQTVWHGVADKDKAVAVARKNTAHITQYAFCRKGQLFDINPLPAAKGLAERKKGMPTEKYGGYNGTTASFFVLVKYFVGKKTDIMVMPVELLFAEKFIKDDDFAEKYAKETISKIENKTVEKTEFLLNKRILKVNTVLSLNGLRVCITGKDSGGTKIGIEVLTPFKTSYENEAYIEKLEAFNKKNKKDPEIPLNDKISSEKNLEIYDLYTEKFGNEPYKYRPNNPLECLKNGRSKFEKLSAKEQVEVLLEIQGMFGKAKTANLKEIGGNKTSGASALSSKISNWKKNYTDVRIIDTSASGMFEYISDYNLFDLL